MGGSISNWKRLDRRAYEYLKPGGWFEQQEYEGRIVSETDPSLSKCPNILLWQRTVIEASLKFGKSSDITGDLKQNLKIAGFVDVRDDVYKVRTSKKPFVEG